MPWIDQIDYEDADMRLKKIYDRVAGPGAQIDNVLKIHSLRPHTLIGHMNLYKNVLHNSENTLPKWYLECIGCYVSLLNGCEYCLDHHKVGMRHAMTQDPTELIQALENGYPQSAVNEMYATGLDYARKLTKALNEINSEDVFLLKYKGFTDGEILEINQVTSYFNYVNRTVLGLGVRTQNEILGLAPKDDHNPDNWNHS